MRHSIALLLLAFPWLSGCSRYEDTAAAAAPGGEQEIEIVFHCFYRASVQTPQGETKEFTLKIPIVQGPVPEIALGISGSAKFKDLTCSASAHYNSLSIHFQDNQSKKSISNILYQFSSPPKNQFAGGHGFTGLHYVHHPESGAELQFWATVKKATTKK